MRGSCVSRQSRRMRVGSAAVFGRRSPLPPHQQLVTVAAALCLVAVVLSAMIVSGDLPWIRPGKTSSGESPFVVAARMCETRATYCVWTRTRARPAFRARDANSHCNRFLTLGAHVRSEGYCSCPVCITMCVSPL